ncbi:pentatricopeptide repeat-containing protein At5g16860-like [Zingiber officinale]|uniref:Pentatricopeptide repeat-containing protein n=1 Tax=Zingiber officinale TaxID=94328 RepID=A0A8J5FI72_ZINOF|nr:pentatricopeptide repeat-containing protein At5g16860-like [Zingiber officinale]KAG6487270.1 hypothetical protein ZIOFF_055855 [Zingiber officinale]
MRGEALRSVKDHYARLLDLCILHKNPAPAARVHSKIIVAGLDRDSFLCVKLIAFYSISGQLHKADAVFSRAPHRDAFVLNSMIRAYSSHGLHREAIDLFHRKRHDGVRLDSYTFSCVVKACASISDLARGKELHGLASERGLHSDVFVGNSLMCMYARCGRMEEALEVFEGMPQQDTVSWTSIISAYAINGHKGEAVEKMRQMIESGLKPDQVTVLAILSMATDAAVVREVHGYVLRSGFELTPMLQNSLISAYGKCGRVDDARKVFERCSRVNRVTWNSLICGYAQNGLFQESMQLLREMKRSGCDLDVITYSGMVSSFSQNNLFDEAMEVFDELVNAGLKPDVVAIASVLPAISGLLLSSCCKEIHAYSFRHWLESDRRIRNALVSVYSKFGRVQCAELVFKAIPDPDVISWSSMIMGYAQNHYFVEALDTFQQMMKAGTKPNPLTVTSVLSACAGVSWLRQGKELHSWAVKNSVDDQSYVGSALVDMYAKCGRLNDSRKVFDLMIEDKSLVTYNAMIGGYAVHGLAEDALEVFRMVKEPDQVSFIAALSACSHGGKVEEGIKLFHSMKDMEVRPREGHYALMVDLLARSGRLQDALDLIATMPMKPSLEIWGAMLGACKIHSNLEMGIYTANQIIESGSGNSGYFVLLSNILANFGRWKEVEEIREAMTGKEVKKGAGCSWVEVNKNVHSFVAKDRSQHPKSESMFMMLNVLNEHMKGMSC